MNRRSFLITSAAAFGRTRTPSANDRVNLGFIGVGGRGGDGLIVDFLQHADCQCVAVCDPFEDRRRKRAAQIDDYYAKRNGAAYKSAAMFADFRQLLLRKDIDAVCIATPDHWHVPILIAAARAGKDVYVEKPLSPSLKWNLKAREVIRKTGRAFQYGTQQRGAGHIRAACEIVRSGRLGKLMSIEVVAPSGASGGATTPMPVPAGFDYEMWQVPSPVRPYTDGRCLTPGHYHIYDYSVGFLGGWGAHPLDVLDFALPAPQVPVQFEGTGLVPKEGLFDTVMDWNVRCTYPDGLVMTFTAGGDSTRFTGSEGSITIRRGGVSSDPPSLTSAFAPPDRFGVMGRNHARNFIDAIRKQAPPESPIDSAVRTDLISHLSDIAVRTGRRITWDPVKESITGDPAAARMLDRPLRKPWKL
ncbi:MAG: Gfo/Idh/MocA family oxidoreductase [Acidobacteria bacterium]|nr:Gfo/Idh/MocA family oxidoreductase [Acidobacteriota bacterium]